MENKVGDHVPTATKVQEWLTKLQAIRADMEKYTVKLTPDDRRHLLNFPPGGEPVAALICDLADKYDIQLPDMPTDGIRDDLTLSQRLAPVVSELALMREQNEDTTRQARSESWQGTTGNYSVLTRVSAANSSLAKELEPARAFFARKRRPAGGGGGTPPAGGGQAP